MAGLLRRLAPDDRGLVGVGVERGDGPLGGLARHPVGVRLDVTTVEIGETRNPGIVHTTVECGELGVTTDDLVSHRHRVGEVQPLLRGRGIVVAGPCLVDDAPESESVEFPAQLADPRDVAGVGGVLVERVDECGEKSRIGVRQGSDSQ